MPIFKILETAKGVIYYELNLCKIEQSKSCISRRIWVQPGKKHTAEMDLHDSSGTCQQVTMSLTSSGSNLVACGSCTIQQIQIHSIEKKRVTDQLNEALSAPSSDPVPSPYIRKISNQELSEVPSAHLPWMQPIIWRRIKKTPKWNCLDCAFEYDSLKHSVLHALPSCGEKADAFASS